MHGGAGMDLGLGSSLPSTLLGGSSSNSPEALLGPFPCVKVSNLPSGVSMEDLLVLFHGYVVIDVLLCSGSQAYVVFANPMDFQMAMQR
jgi:heterogeneous nuclear ribonucleoprotein F/H